MKYSNIGGQAVMEGVMMRSGDRYAVAVRTADQKIVVGKQEYHPLIPAAKVAKIPILRGVISFIDSLILSIGLFMMLPYFMSRSLRLWIHSEAVISVLEACLRMVIFFGYLFLISRMKNIQRTFAYHGAEHKCINCIEHGLELNVENVRASSREHVLGFSSSWD